MKVSVRKFMKKSYILGAIIMLTISLTGCGDSETLSEYAANNLENAGKTTEAAEAEESEEKVEQEETESAPVLIEVENFFSEAFFAEAEKAAVPLSLELLSEKNNGISFTEDWLKENQLSLPLLEGNGERSFYDENYIYSISGEYADTTCLEILDKESNHPLYSVSFAKGLGDLRGVWAKLEEEVLYINPFYNGYAQPSTNYVMAIDMKTGNVLWRSEDQTCNSRYFIVKEEVILCGYGFTDEPDYLYQLDKKTGQVVSQMKLAKMADCLIAQDGKLYVHTYNRDYVFAFN